MASWAPSAKRAAITARAALLRRIRGFFDDRDVTEVVTPAMSAAGTVDPAIDSYAIADGAAPRWLQTSPEFAMKRLLAAGSGPIYQICPVFRRGEHGRLHAPEFQMLEWYRPTFDHYALMRELGQLLTRVCSNPVLAGEPSTMTYRAAFVRHAAIDPFSAGKSALARCLSANGVDHSVLHGAPVDTWLDLIMATVVVPRLNKSRPIMIYDFPASQAALATVREDHPPVAERFELYAAGVELANGFHELTDAREQSERFCRERARRAGEAPPVDQRLLAALRAGLPDCAGVAVGVDRLLMVELGLQCIDDVLTFAADRA